MNLNADFCSFSLGLVENYLGIVLFSSIVQVCQTTNRKSSIKLVLPLEACVYDVLSKILTKSLPLPSISTQVLKLPIFNVRRCTWINSRKSNSIHLSTFRQGLLHRDSLTWLSGDNLHIYKKDLLVLCFHLGEDVILLSTFTEQRSLTCFIANKLYYQNSCSSTC